LRTLYNEGPVYGMKAFPPFRLDPVNQCLWKEDVRISLAPKIFAVLKYLVDNPGRLVTQDELLEAVWPDTYVQPEVLRKYILELGKALGDHPKDPLYIETFPKRGYQFVAPVTEQSAAQEMWRTPAITAPPPAPSAPAPVGRSAELRQLNGYLDRVFGGQRHVVFVTGEAGVGKTTLIDAFQRSAESRGARFARGQCVEGFGGQEAYYPVLDAIGQLIGGPRSESVVQALASLAPTWLIQFPQLLKAGQREELQREILGATRERMVREICTALEALTAETPLVLALEDLHWVDTSTLDLLSAIARGRNAAKLLLIGTYRPVELILRHSPLKPLKQDLHIHRLCFELAVERLSERDVSDYLAAEMDGLPEQDKLASLIHRQSDGNPLFMTALIGEMVEKGVLQHRDGRWTLSVPVDQMELGVPDTLQQMLELQVDQLTEQEQRVLRGASIAGQRFSAWAVGATLGMDVAPVEEVCEALVQRQQFLRPGRSGNLIGSEISASYEFRHSLYREALYRRLTPSQRASFHQSLAVKAESLLGAERAREFASELALHFESGREYEKAARHLLFAAENGAWKYAHRDSIMTLDRALKLLKISSTETSRQLEIDILERMSDAHYALGEMERSARVDERAATLAGERGMKTAQAEALTRSARALSFLDPDDCVIVCERAVEVSASTDDPLLQARAALLAACWRIINDGWTQRDADICADAREKIRRLRGAALPAYQEVLYAHVQSLQGQYLDSCAIADAGLKTAEEIHSLVVYLSCLSSKALALIHLGWWGDLRRVLEHGIELAQKNGNSPWANIFEALLAWLHMQSCDFDEGRRRGLDLLKTHTEQPMGQVQSIALLTVGYCELALGNPEQALVCCTKVRDRQPKPKVFLQWYWRMISEFGIVGSLLALGDLEAADTAAQIFLEEVQTTADPALRSPAWDTLARVAAAKGNLPRALECAGRAVKEMRGFDLPSVAWRVHRTASLLHAQAGHMEEAVAHRDKAEAALKLVADSFEPQDRLRATLLAAAANLKMKLQNELENSGVAGAGDRPASGGAERSVATAKRR
jgi:DNA-binding winged helix-turn-helix (wHTH) protein/tetratricopeptide (TPR) repeat protein